MDKSINIGRKYSGGVFDGLFGNPIKEKKVTNQYRLYINFIFRTHPIEREWLRGNLKDGARLFCPGCGYDSLTCHARILKEELAKYKDTQTDLI